MSHIAITGVPHAGKTTFAEQYARALNLPLRHTDMLADEDLTWNEEVEVAADWFNSPERTVIEGCLVAHALQHRMKTFHPPGIARLFVFPHALIRLSPGQQNLQAGVATILNRVIPWLEEFDVEVTIKDDK